MEHGFIDLHSKHSGFLQALDPRTKIIAFIIATIAILAVPVKSLAILLFYLFVILVLTIASRVPLGFLAKKSLYFLPFTLTLTAFSFLGLRAGSLKYLILTAIFAKSWLTFSLTVLLVSTTDFQSLLKGFEKLKVPKLFVTLFSFIYRYLFVIVDEFQRMNRAAVSRGSKKLSFVKYLGSAIGVVFARSYERADRIYQAMLSRSFTGEVKIINELSFGKKDKGFLLLSAGLILIILLIQMAGVL